MGESPRSHTHDRQSVEMHNWMEPQEYERRLLQTGAEIFDSLQAVKKAVEAYAAVGKLPLEIHTRRRNVWHTFEIESVDPKDGDRAESWFDFLHAAAELNDDRSIFVEDDKVGVQLYSSAEYDPSEPHQP